MDSHSGIEVSADEVEELFALSVVLDEYIVLGSLEDEVALSLEEQSLDPIHLPVSLPVHQFILL